MSPIRPKDFPISVRLFLGAVCVIAFAILPAIPTRSSAQGYSPDEAASHMTLPEGLEVTLVAAEPLVRQPVAIDFDDRGRLWVVQYLQYPNPAGLRRVKVDRWSRTAYDRVPEPPPRGPRGADRITILEDADGDGRMDRGKDFIDGLNLASGFAFGHGGIFVLQVPYLLFYPDANRDDAPDSDPEVLLKGFGMEDAHSVANSLTWGPDGWLYGLQGSTVTARINGIEFQQGVWRYHPVARKFELFCEGGGNMWGLDYDERGNLFASTNFGPYLMIHAVQGAYYWKSFAKHGELHNPFAYGYFDHVMHHNETGGHVTVGGLVYQGALLPEPFRGRYIGANLLSHTIYWHATTPRGSTFETTHAGTLLDSRDTSFAPSDLTTGPDGALYVTDWNDRRTAHPDPDADWDRSNGRIYRIAPKGSRPPEEFDLAGKDSAELLRLLDSDNAWFRRRARLLLTDQARKDRGIGEQLRTRIFESDRPNHRLEFFWALHATGRLDALTAKGGLNDPDASIRRWSVQFIGDDPAFSASLAPDLIKLAAGEPDRPVLSQLASTAARLNSESGLRLAHTIALRPEAADDPHLPLQIWWAVERHALQAPDLTIDLFGSAAAFRNDLANTVILPRLIRRFAAHSAGDTDALCVRLLNRARQEDRLELLLAGLEDGLRERGGRRTKLGQGDLFSGYAEPVASSAEEKTQPANEIAPALAVEIEAIWREAPEDPVRLRLALLAKRTGSVERTIEWVRDHAKPASDRQKLIATLAGVPKAQIGTALLDLAISDDAESVRNSAMDSLRGVQGKDIPPRLIELYPRAPSSLRSRIRELLLSRKEWARTLLTAVDDGVISPADFTPAQLRNVALFQDPPLDALVKKHWGTIREGTPEEKLADARRLNNDLRAASGDPARGREVFKKSCAQCHTLFGEGGKIGPDLTQSNRMDTDYLLMSLVDPSAVVRKEFAASIVELKDGGVLSGVIVARPPGALTLANAENQAIHVTEDTIREVRDSSVSIMPDELATSLKPDELRDLFSYLQSTGSDAPKETP